MGRGRAPCCEKVGLNKGSWTPAEDMRLVSYIQKFGHGNWRSLPKRAGLLRCGKSCRLRWINYLRPDIKRGNFTKEEEDTLINLHALLGNKWSKIASYLPGRTDNEIKNVWNTHLKKRIIIPTSSSSSDHSPSPSPSSSSSLPSSSSSSDQSEAKSSNNNGQEVHQEVKVDDYDINIEELIIFDEMLDIFPIENKTTTTMTTTTTIASSSSSCSLNCEYIQNESENESKKWLAYLEKELDLWECEDTTTTTTTTTTNNNNNNNNNNYYYYNKQEYEKKEIVDYMESEHDDPVLSYFQRGPSSPQNFLLDFPSLDSMTSTSNGFLL